MKGIKLILTVGVTLLLFAACKAGKEDTKKPPQDQFRITFHEAIQEKMRDNFDVSASLFEKCLSMRPNSDAVHYALSDVYEALGNNDKSINHAVQAYQLDEENRWYQIRLAELYFEKGDYHKSAEFYAISIEQEKNLDVKFMYAQSLIYSNQYKKAIAILDEIEVETGLSPHLSLTKHDMYLQIGDPEGAKAELTKLIEDNPSNIENRLIIADYFLQTNQAAAAEKMANEAMAIAPENGEVRLIMADISIRRGDLTKCFEHLEIGFKDPNVSLSRKVGLIGNLQQYAFEDSDDGREIQAGLASLYDIIYNEEEKNDTLHTQYGFFLQLQNKPLEAIEQFKKVVEINPNSYESWMQLLYAQMDIMEYSGMMETGRKVVEVFPSQPTVFLLGAIAAYETTDYDTAEEWLFYGRDLIVDDPALAAEFHHQIGVLYWKQKEYEEAQKYFKEAKEMDKFNGNIYESIALCYVDQGKNELAFQEAQSALDQAPTNAFFHDLKAQVYLKAGNFDKAKQSIENAMVYEPNNPMILEHYGDIYFKLGNVEKALEYWNSAMDKGGYNIILLKKLRDKKYYEE